MICIDQFVNSEAPNDLYIFQGPVSEQESVSNKFVEEFKKAASKRDVSVHVKEPQFTVNRASKYIQYEHQIYSEKGIPSLTISARETQNTHRYEKYSVFDTAISNDDLRRNILILSEAIVKIVYTFKDPNINFFIDNDSIVSETYTNQIKNFLAKNPRAPHML